MKFSIVNFQAYLKGKATLYKDSLIANQTLFLTRNRYLQNMLGWDAPTRNMQHLFPEVEVYYLMSRQDDPLAYSAFEKDLNINRKQFTQWIEEAKEEDIIQMLREEHAFMNLPGKKLKDIIAQIEKYAKDKHPKDSDAFSQVITKQLKEFYGIGHDQQIVDEKVYSHNDYNDFVCSALLYLKPDDLRKALLMPSIAKFLVNEKNLLNNVIQKMVRELPDDSFVYLLKNSPCRIEILASQSAFGLIIDKLTKFLQSLTKTTEPKGRLVPEEDEVLDLVLDAIRLQLQIAPQGSDGMLDYIELTANSRLAEALTRMEPAQVFPILQSLLQRYEKNQENRDLLEFIKYIVIQKLSTFESNAAIFSDPKLAAGYTDLLDNLLKFIPEGNPEANTKSDRDLLTVYLEGLKKIQGSQSGSAGGPEAKRRKLS